MADLALVFHWHPSEMDDMSVEDLAAWRERARVRHQPDEE